MKSLTFKTFETMEEIVDFAANEKLRNKDIVSVSEYGYGYMIWYFS